VTRFCAISDLHGHLPEIPECDVLLIAGDVCPTVNHSLSYQRDWLFGPFQDWLCRCPVEHEIVGVAGNHDFIFERNPYAVEDLPWVYLQDEWVDACGFKIHGTPWQPPFFNWAFNAEEDKLAMAFDLIDNDTDIVVGHGPPYLLGDQTYNGQHVGSQAMLKRLDVVRPQVMVCGHIHNGYGRYPTSFGEIINAAIVDDAYMPANPPVEFEL
jgi:Icc-related predicted phosphoesterase